MNILSALVITILLIQVILTAAACCAEEARPQMGMGKVQAQRTDRLDIIYSRAVVTPHMPWMSPYASGPVRVLAVPSVDEGRTLIELAQRLSMEYEAVTIDPAWDINKWTIGFGKDYGARAEPNDYALLYRYLTESLTAPPHYDVLLMYGIHGWARLPRRARSAILRRVREGAGLVIVGPFLGSADADAEKEFAEISPLGPVQGEKLTAEEYTDAIRGESAAGPWRPEAPHFITDAIPWSALPYSFLRHYRYSPGIKAQVLVSGHEGAPVIAVKTYGRGRVVAFGYVNYGLAPVIPWESYGRILSDHYWEYLYGLLCRALVWAAGKEPAVRLRAAQTSDPHRFPAEKASQRSLSLEVSGSVPAKARLRVEFRDEMGRVEASRFARAVRAGTISVRYPRGLSGGLHTADCILEANGKRVDWLGSVFEIVREGEIQSIRCDRPMYKAGEEVRVEVETEASVSLDLTLELVDNYGRVLDRRKASVPSGGYCQSLNLTMPIP